MKSHENKLLSYILIPALAAAGAACNRVWEKVNAIQTVAPIGTMFQPVETQLEHMNKVLDNMGTEVDIIDTRIPPYLTRESAQETTIYERDVGTPTPTPSSTPRP